MELKKKKLYPFSSKLKSLIKESGILTGTFGVVCTERVGADSRLSQKRRVKN